MQTKRYYVYILADQGTPFYVGKGSGCRITDHEAEARRGCECHKCRKIRKIWRSGRAIKRLIVTRTDNEQEAYQYEAKLISQIGLGRLTNVHAKDVRSDCPIYDRPEKPADEYTESEYRSFLNNTSGLSSKEVEECIRDWKSRLYRTYRQEWAVCRRMGEDEKADALRAKFEAIGMSLGKVNQKEMPL